MLAQLQTLIMSWRLDPEVVLTEHTFTVLAGLVAIMLASLLVSLIVTRSHKSSIVCKIESAPVTLQKYPSSDSFLHKHIGDRPDLIEVQVKAKFKEEGWFNSESGARLRTYRTVPPQPRGVCIFFHGLNEHSNRYGMVAEKLSSQDYVVAALDYEGYGKSEGERGLIPCVGKITSDVVRYAQCVKSEFPGLPCFLMGHSLGGGVVLRCALEQPQEWTGVVAIAPAIACDVHPILQKMSGIVASIAPKIPVTKLAPPDASSKNIACAHLCDNDELVHKGKMVARTGNSLVRHLQHMSAHMELLETPFLLCHGAKDLITSPEGSRKLYEVARAKDKSLKIYEDGWHDLLWEPEWEEVLGDITTWVNVRRDLCRTRNASV